MNAFEHQRHKPPRELPSPRELVICCPPMRSGVNLSRIVRAASCWGVRRVVACGNPKLDPKIARDGVEQVELIQRRTMLPALAALRDEGYELVGVEQATGSECLFDFAFQHRTALVLGHERKGIESDCLKTLDRVVEIPVYGLPNSFNVATAAAMAMYEYCRQFR